MHFLLKDCITIWVAKLKYRSFLERPEMANSTSHSSTASNSSISLPHEIDDECGEIPELEASHGHIDNNLYEEEAYLDN